MWRASKVSIGTNNCRENIYTLLGIVVKAK